MTFVDVIADPAVVDRHRYPGVRSFQEPDAICFFGRRRAAEELLLRVLSVRLLLQFASSGAGKTSLLNAGLFPRLRPHRYLPVSVRLNRPEEALLESVKRSLRSAAEGSAIDDPVIPNAAVTVWDLLADTQLWTRELLLLTPVLVFDQFEEVFTLRDAAYRRDFARQIGELSRGRSGTDGDSRGAPDVKIIISLREEYLGALEEMTADIPDLFAERLRLSPLTAGEAREAITEPARLDGDWLSLPFEFDSACVDMLIDFIDGVSERVQVIEPLTLQLVCQRAESIAAAKPAGEPRLTVTIADFGGAAGLEALVHTYYTSELARIADAGMRKRAAAMFEQGLLDPSGKRLMLEQDEIRRQFGIDETVLTTLVDGRLLRREPRNESVFYEVSHDRLTDVIARHRTPRLPKWVRPALGIAALLIVVLAVAFFFVLRAKNDAERARQSTAHALNVLFGDVLGERLREAGLSDAFEKVLGMTTPDATTDRLAQAAQLRRLGELAWERDTNATSRKKWTDALALIDGADAAASASVPFRTERAQILKDLGDVLVDEGKVTEGEGRYAEAVRLWTDVLKTDRDPSKQIDAIAAETALASTWEKLGDFAHAETGYAGAAYRGAQTLEATYRDQSSDSAFLIGRAMEEYADAALALAELRWSGPDLNGARALAAGLMQLRPLSAQARIKLGTASATYGNYVVGPDNWPLARRLFDESNRQFRDVTQFDPQNRRMTRELAAERLLTAHGVSLCADNRRCRTLLQPGELEAAGASARLSTGVFEGLLERNPGSRSLRDDIAWAKEVQAALLRARNQRADALALLDEAIAIRRQNIADEADQETRAALVMSLQTKALYLGETGRRDEGLDLLNDTIKSADQFKSEIWQHRLRADALSARSTILASAARTADARTAEVEASALYKIINDQIGANRKKALAANDEAIGVVSQARHLSGEEKVHTLGTAAEKYRAALAESPMEPVIWSNLHSACTQAADAIEAAAPTRSSDASMSPRVEAERRCALESAWIAWILTDDMTGAAAREQRLKTLYEERRRLAMLLRSDNHRVLEALALADQGAREAEQLLGQQPSSNALSLVADSYYGLGLMREESHREGWEQTMRAAILRGEELRDKEPQDISHRIWIASVRSELARRLNAWKRAGGPRELDLAQQECTQAMRLARTAADWSAAQSCLADVRK